MKRERKPPPPMQLALIDSKATRVVNIKREPGWKDDARYLAIHRLKGVDPRTIRPGTFGSLGNPFNPRDPMVGTKAMEMFEAYARQRMVDEPRYRWAVRQIDGKILGCYCVGQDGRGKCHGHILIKLCEELKALEQR